MHYKWSNEVEIVSLEDKVIYINPQNGHWLKSSKSLKKLLDRVLEENLVNQIEDNKLKNTIKQFINCDLITNNENIHKNKKNINVINSLYLTITKKCNLKCDFCSVLSSPEVKDKQDFNIKYLNNIINFTNKYKVKRIIITGGEPLLHNKLIDIINILYDKTKSRIILLTNGLLLTEEIINIIKDKVVAINISVENIFEERNEMDKKKIRHVLQLLRDKKINTCASFVLTKKNKDQIFKFMDLCEEFNCSISVKNVAPIGRAKSNINLLLTKNEYEKTYIELYKYIFNKRYGGENFKRFIFSPLVAQKECSAFGKILSVTLQGDIYSCHSLESKEFYLGNINKSEPNKIIDKICNNRFTDEYNSCFNIDYRESCNRCDIKYFCGGKCFAEIFSEQDYKNIIPLQCKLRKKLVNFKLLYYNEREAFLENLRSFNLYLEK